MSQRYLGIDLGGTKIEACVLDSDFKTLFRERIATPRFDYNASLDVIADLAQQAEIACGLLTSIGMGIPGCIDERSGVVKNANSTWINGRNLQQDINQRLGREVAIANDADCFALSEALDGAAKDANSVFAVILGTGVGGALVYQNTLLRGANGLCGEWGHNPMPVIPGTQEVECYCGKVNCIETFLSGPGFAQRFEHRFNTNLSAEQIVQLATSDAHAQAFLQEYANWLALALSTVVNIFDPQVIVLGGGMSNIDSLYAGLTMKLSEQSFGPHSRTPVVKALHGDSSGVRGAAMLTFSKRQ